MLNPISPELQRMLYKERENELELTIQRRLAREARQAIQPAKQAYPWYARAARWLKERTPLRAFQKQVAAAPAHMEDACQGLPC